MKARAMLMACLIVYLLDRSKIYNKSAQIINCKTYKLDSQLNNSIETSTKMYKIKKKKNI